MTERFDALVITDVVQTIISPRYRITIWINRWCITDNQPTVLEVAHVDRGCGYWLVQSGRPDPWTSVEVPTIRPVSQYACQIALLFAPKTCDATSTIG